MRPGIERITAAQAEEQQRHVAGALVGRGLAPGDRVAIVARSSPATLVTILAALRRGIIPVVLNPALLPHEQDALLADADPVLVIRDGDLDALAAGAPVELAPAPLGRPMHYTSGTTGVPKGVWSGVLDEADARALLLEERTLWGFDPADVHLVLSPLHHSAPVRFAAGTLLAGGDVVFTGRFDATRTALAIASERPTTAFCVPSHLQRLLATGEPPLSSFRLLAHAGAPCPAPLKREILAAFPRGSVWEFYGATEGQFTACSTEEWLEHPGTVGRARPGRAVAIDDDDRLIWCAVPAHARFEYWRDPVRTDAAWRDGAFTVGDVGHLDDGDYLFLDGRRDDLVISGGVNVYPAEVERALHELPGITDVAVFGVPDERWGERVCAAVVGAVTPTEVQAWARERLAAYKCPKEVVVVDALPLNPNGKVKRSSLAAELGLG